MPTDHNPQHGRRPHYNRGRRGPDRRGTDRRATPQAPEPGGRASGGDHVDVEQIMRDIRVRIAQRHGIELSTLQIQELAARRLEAILDPRTLNPSLLEQLRKNAGAAPAVAPAAPDPGFTFDDATLFESHRGLLRFMRRLLHPILKLFFNPAPLTEALKTQSRLNRERSARDAEREQRQTEWNALHYDILQRLVTEVSRVSLDMQSLALRVESLSAKVDFNDRRVRSLETSVPQGRPHQQPRSEQPRPEQPRAEPPPAPPVAAAAPGESVITELDATGDVAAPAAEGTRRKRRRRRGRRSGGGSLEAAPVAAGAVAGDAATGDATDVDLTGADEGDEDEAADAPAAPPVVAGFVSPSAVDPIVAETPMPEAAAPEAEAVAPPSVAAPTPAPVPAPAPEPIQPTPPRDEPSPAAPVDHQDPGPPDR